MSMLRTSLYFIDLVLKPIRTLLEAKKQNETRTNKQKGDSNKQIAPEQQLLKIHAEYVKQKNINKKQPEENMKQKDKVLFILTSKGVLCTLFPGRNCLVYNFIVFSVTNRKKKRKHKKDIIHKNRKGGLPSFRCYYKFLYPPLIL